MSKFPFPSLYNGTGPGGSDILDKFAESESPKLKFNFFVRFSFRTNEGGPINESRSGSRGGGLSLATNLLAVKHATRINPTIEYADVNFYGYRTKVATKTDFGDVTLTFYDDSSNRTHTIIDTYMESVSPLVSTNQGGTGTSESQLSSRNYLEERQTIGALRNGSELGIIDKIEILHEGVNTLTTYRYANPKIRNIIADDLDMTISEVNTIAMTFTYDAYNVVKEDKPNIEPISSSINGPLPDADDVDSGIDPGLPGPGGPQGPVVT